MAFRPLSSPIFSCLIVKGPWWNRDKRRGDGIAGYERLPVALSCHDSAKGARSRPSLCLFPSYSSFLFLLRFLPSRLCEIRSWRSATFKLRAGNGSRRLETKCVHAPYPIETTTGPQPLFLSRSRAFGRCGCAGLTKKDLQLILVIDEDYLTRTETKRISNKYEYI